MRYCIICALKIKRMQNIPKTVCQKFKDARRTLGLTQSALAREVGCQQAALSMFESGRPTKLSDDYVVKIAARLNLDLAQLIDTAKKLAEPIPLRTATIGFCPDPECPSNTAYAVGERTFLRVTLQKGIYCAQCGEVLERRCPACGAVLNEGACCTMCGAPYVRNR